MSIVLVLLASMCAGFLVYEIFNAYMGYQTKNWKNCVGELIKWDIEEIVVMGSSFNDFRYRYVVSGQEYESKKIGFGFPRSVGLTNTLFQHSATVFDEIVSNAPKVTVYYSPENPMNGVLCTGIQDYHVIRIIGYGFGSIVFAVIATLV